jgi:hypothetical protein
MSDTAQADQLAAAVRDAAAHHHAIARHEGLPIVPLAGQPWITGQVRIQVRALARGTARLCPHIGASPTVLYGAAWAPRRLVCRACIATLRPDPTEDGTCDRCRQTAGVLHPGMVQSGPLLLAYGLCDTCNHRTGLANKSQR